MGEFERSERRAQRELAQQKFPSGNLLLRNPTSSAANEVSEAKIKQIIVVIFMISMIHSLIFSLVSALIISLISLIGIIFFLLKIKTNKIIENLVGFATGALFGDVFFHIFPEILEKQKFLVIAPLVLVGIFLFFIVEEIICWRHCHIETSKSHPHPVALMNLIGDGVHNFLDGLAIGVSFLTNFALGITTTLAILFHEIPQEIGDFSILIYAGLPPKKALLFNFLSALAAILGVLIPFIFQLKQNNLVYFLPIIAGGFIYIAGSDLVPLIKNQRSLNKSIIYLLMMSLGAIFMYLLLFLE